MSRLDDLVKFFGWRESRVLRKLADEFDNNQEYYSQFDSIDERIFAAYEKIVNRKLINYKQYD